MNVGTRIALVDDRSTASNPGNVSVQPFRFARHFSAWPVLFGAGLAATGVWAASKPTQWPAPALLLVLNLLYWLRVRLRFRLGCVNPSIVVSTSPFTLAVYTDLSTGVGEYPVIKIMTHPRPQGIRLNVGDACASVAMYTGDGNAEHWEDFEPILVHCATNSNATISEVLETIPAEEWSHLEEGLKHIPQPLKLGLYPFKRRMPEAIPTSN